MLFNLAFKHNIAQTGDDFGSSQVVYFEATPVLVGSTANCDLTVSAAETEQPFAFTITGGDNDDYRLVPTGDSQIFLNNIALPTAGTALTSGDEIRVGHVTFRFQKVYRQVGQGRRADLVAIFAKLTIAAIIIAELSFVYWLPHRFQSEKLLAEQLCKQHTLMLLDELRTRKRIPADALRSPLADGARKAVGEELDAVARFLREHEDRLTREQWQWFFSNLQAFQLILEQIDTGAAFPELPNINLEQAVNARLATIPNN